MYIIPNIPLFYVIITSVLFGLVLSYLFNLVASISTSFVLRSKNNEIKQEKAEVLELTKRIHQLELEHEKQKNGALVEVADPNAL